MQASEPTRRTGRPAGRDNPWDEIGKKNKHNTKLRDDPIQLALYVPKRRTG